MSDLRIIVIDEPIHVYDEMALNLWQKAIWVKAQEYHGYYETSVFPCSTEDFFSTHIIIAEELGPQKFNPLSMYRICTRSRYKKFFQSFYPETLIKGTAFENSFSMQKILREPADIGYLSAWATAPVHRKQPPVMRKIRDLVTTSSCLAPETLGCNRWLVAGVTQRQADKYLRWIGCKDVLPDSIPHPTNKSVLLRMLYLPNTKDLPDHTQKVIEECSSYWSNRLFFGPQTNTVEKAA